MAGLDTTPLPTAHQQLSAVAWMRWRMYANGFRRLKDGALIARIFAYLIGGIFSLGFVAGAIFLCGLVAYFAVSDHHPHYLFYLLWFLFLLWHFVAINSYVATSKITFDETTLIRFPLTLRRYLVLKLAASLMTIGFFAGLSIFTSIVVGITLAGKSLFLPAATSMALFFVFNLLLSRALQIWISRFLSTRFARGIMSAFFVLIFAGTQLIRLKAVQHQAHLVGGQASGVLSFLFTSRYRLLFALFPPSIAADAVVGESHLLKLLDFSALTLLIPVVLALYAWRVGKQFRGEFLTENPTAPKPQKTFPTPRTTLPTTASHKITSPILACLQKEFITQRRNGGQFVAMLMPLIFVVILSAEGNLFSRHAAYALPMAVGYALMNIVSFGYNLFGTESTGIQFYLIAPLRIRDVIFSKHIILSATCMLQAVLAAGIALAMAHGPTPVSALLTTFFWTLFFVFVNLSAGTFQSILSPRKMDPNKISLSRRNSSGSRSGGLIVLGVLLGSFLVTLPVLALCNYLGRPWWPVPIFALLSASAAGIYAWTLTRIDATFLNHRENLIEVLAKSSI